MPTESKERAELTGVPKPELTASGALSLGDRVSLISGGNGQASGSSNSEKWIGFPAANISNGASGEINVLGYIASGFSGLTVNSTYYVASDGTISTTQRENFRVGRAVSATEILVEEGLVGPVIPQYGASGNDIMYGGGYNSTGSLSAIEMKTFASTAIGTSHGTLNQNRNYPAAGTDGTQAMFVAGNGGSGYTDTCELVQYSSNTTGTSHGLLQRATMDFTATSDGYQLLSGGGRTTGGSNVNTCELKQFASTATAVDHGDLYAVMGYHASGSDGSQALFGGGTPGPCSIKLFSSNATSIYHGELSVVRRIVGAASDSTQVMFGGGYNAGVFNTCDMVQFSANTTAAGHGVLSQARYGATACSDGSQVMFAGGNSSASGNQSSQVNTCDMKQFASTATAVDHGDMLVTREGFAAASGN